MRVSLWRRISHECAVIDLELLTVAAYLSLMEKIGGSAFVIVSGGDKGGQQRGKHKGALLHFASSSQPLFRPYAAH
jgi:hypothetical protein